MSDGQMSTFLNVSGDTVIVGESVEQVQSKLAEGQGVGWATFDLQSGHSLRVRRESVDAYWPDPLGAA